MTWDAPSSAGTGTLGYDTLQATDPANFQSATCVESQDTDTQATIAETPARGQVPCYLVRAANSCGGGRAARVAIEREERYSSSITTRAPRTSRLPFRSSIRTGAMMPPRRTRLDAWTPDDPLALLTAVVRSGRLVELLRGDGLSRGMVRELTGPHGTAKLRAVLEDHVSSGPVHSTFDPPRRQRRTPELGCKVLVFRPAAEVAR